MDSQGTITISPEFFSKAMKDYTQPSWAWVREAFQNSIDAGSTIINVWVKKTDAGCEIIVNDNGRGMNEDILFNKFLCLGGSAKDMNNGSVGGFGKAKELLLLGQIDYSITTQNLSVKGSGGSYQFEKNLKMVQGCTISARTKFDSSEIENAVRKFVLLQDRNVSFYMNNIPLHGRLRKNTHKKSSDGVEFYVNHSGLANKNLMVVRVAGIPMFTTVVNYKKGVVIIELPNSTKLTSNRDGLTWATRNEIDSFINNLTVNKSAAFGSKPIEYFRYQGAKVTYDTTKAIEELQVNSAVQEEAVSNPGVVRGTLPVERTLNSHGAVSKITYNPPVNRLNHEFLIKNSTGLTLPDYYRPDSEKFGKYAQDLAATWKKQISILANLLKLEGYMQVGFIIDEDAVAEYERTNGVHIFLINPATIVKQEKSNSRSLKNRYNVHKDKLDILSSAVHEMVHGIGFSDHDEDYANQLTSAFTIVMKNISKIK